MESESGDELPEIENIQIQSRSISPEFQPDLPSRPPTPENLSTLETSTKAPKKKRIRKDNDYWSKHVGERKSTMIKTKPTVFAIGADADHPTDAQARSGPQAAKWEKAWKMERAQLEKYQVFTKVQESQIPEGTKIIDTKWVYIIKRKPDGTIEKYKARKVGRGFMQEAGVSYDLDKTYAQMIRPETFKILLVKALYREWAVRQWDVIAAYLKALLKHNVYITDINKAGETEFWKVDKALYGLKQAGHE